MGKLTDPAIFAARGLGVAVLVLAVFLGGCGRYRPVPPVWEPGAYRPVSVGELRSPGRSGLAAGDLIKAPAYFWEFVIYDPAIGRNYLTMLRHPIIWPRLEWCAVYETPQMRGYFDRLVMDAGQRRAYQPSRLDHVMVYGELAPLGGGLLYVRVHRLEKLEEP